MDVLFYMFRGRFPFPKLFPPFSHWLHFSRRFPTVFRLAPLFPQFSRRFPAVFRLAPLFPQFSRSFPTGSIFPAVFPLAPLFPQFSHMLYFSPTTLWLSFSVLSPTVSRFPALFQRISWNQVGLKSAFLQHTGGSSPIPNHPTPTLTGQVEYKTIQFYTYQPVF